MSREEATAPSLRSKAPSRPASWPVLEGPCFGSWYLRQRLRPQADGALSPPEPAYPLVFHVAPALSRPGLRPPNSRCHLEFLHFLPLAPGARPHGHLFLDLAMGLGPQGPDCSPGSGGYRAFACAELPSPVSLPQVTEVADSCPRCGQQFLGFLPLLKDRLFLLLRKVFVIWIMETPSNSTGSAWPASQRLQVPWGPRQQGGH